MTLEAAASRRPAVVGRRSPLARLQGAMGAQQAGLLVALIVMLAAFSVFAPNFADTRNILNVFRGAAFFGIVALGMTFVIVSAEIDVSVGSQAAFASSLLGWLNVSHGMPLGLAIVVVLAEGLLLGAGAGFIRARFGIPSFIVTLALYSALRGGGYLLTDAFPIAINSSRFNYWGAGTWLGGVPVPAYLMIALFVVFWFISARTSFGRSTYAVGGNAQAAHLSGINVSRIRISVLATTGLLAAFTGILISAQISAGNSNIGQGLEFEVITAVIIGGTSLFGGRGTMFGTLLGVLFIAFLDNGLVLLGVNTYAQQVVQGSLVLAAVMVSVIRRPKRLNVYPGNRLFRPRKGP